MKAALVHQGRCREVLVALAQVIARVSHACLGAEGTAFSLGPCSSWFSVQEKCSRGDASQQCITAVCAVRRLSVMST